MQAAYCGAVQISRRVVWLFTKLFGDTK